MKVIWSICTLLIFSISCSEASKNETKSEHSTSSDNLTIKTQSPGEMLPFYSYCSDCKSGLDRCTTAIKSTIDAIAEEIKHNNSCLDMADKLLEEDVLQLADANLTDLSPLKELPNLVALFIDGNQINDLSPLSSLPKLNKLYANENQISDLAPLQNLNSLIVLELHANEIESLDPLKGLIKLERLRISQNKISDLSPLSGLKNLSKIWLMDNNIDDYSALIGLPLEYIDITF